MTSMPSVAPTPADLKITPRDRRFGSAGATARLWHGGRVEATAIYNALSAVFPKGEALFVESVRAFSDGADPKLAAEIKAFTTQEVIHSREHLAFNKRAVEGGYDLTLLDERLDARLAVIASRPKIVSLAVTMALEHFTAILAHELLSDPRHLKGAEARPPSSGVGTPARRSSIRASLMTPGSTPPATGAAGSAGK
jgi:predicted metal-dependent hydrolase